MRLFVQKIYPWYVCLVHKLRAFGSMATPKVVLSSIKPYTPMTKFDHSNGDYNICPNNFETPNHIFLHCFFAINIWRSVLRILSNNLSRTTWSILIIFKLSTYVFPKIQSIPFDLQYYAKHSRPFGRSILCLNMTVKLGPSQGQSFYKSSAHTQGNQGSSSKGKIKCQSLTTAIFGFSSFLNPSLTTISLQL